MATSGKGQRINLVALRATVVPIVDAGVDTHSPHKRESVRGSGSIM